MRSPVEKGVRDDPIRGIEVSHHLEVVGTALAVLADAEDEPVQEAGYDSADDWSSPVYLRTKTKY